MVLDLIVKPLRDIQINDYEFACLKAIVFFDPGIYHNNNKKKIQFNLLAY